MGPPQRVQAAGVPLSETQALGDWQAMLLLEISRWCQGSKMLDPAHPCVVCFEEKRVCLDSVGMLLPCAACTSACWLWLDSGMPFLMSFGWLQQAAVM